MLFSSFMSALLEPSGHAIMGARPGSEPRTCRTPGENHTPRDPWPRIKRDVARYVKACHACQRAGKSNGSIKPAPLQPINSVGTPFERMIIDGVEPPGNLADYAFGFCRRLFLAWKLAAEHRCDAKTNN